MHSKPYYLQKTFNKKGPPIDNPTSWSHLKVPEESRKELQPADGLKRVAINTRAYKRRKADNVDTTVDAEGAT